MRVSCVIPAYNEARTIAGVIEAVRACPQVDEVIVVSDGSSDDTPRRAADAGADHVIVLPRNGGKSRAVLEALGRARGDVIVLIDGDLYGLGSAHIEQLLAPVLAGRAEMAVALFAGDLQHRLQPLLSGQRTVHRSLLLGSERLERAGFGLEIVLGRLARDRRSRIARVMWQGVSHRSKHAKYGTLNGVRLKVRASSDLARQAGTILRGRGLAARKGLRMVVTLLALTITATVAAPLLLIRPRHATAHTFPRLGALGSGDRLLVVAAHPDDEVIGAGGLIASARQAGAEVTVIVVTNGDSNRLSAAMITHTVRPQAKQFLVESLVRQQETLEALGRLGVPASHVIYLGFPDRAVDQVMRSDTPVRSRYTGFDRVGYANARVTGAPYTRRALIDAMREIVHEVRPTMIVTHLPFDRHADHRAVAELVDEVRGSIPTYGFLVHAAGFPRPLRLSPRSVLVPPASLASVPGWTWMQFDVAPEMGRMKQDAINAYRSQILTPYLRLLLAAFVRTNELFAVREL